MYSTVHILQAVLHVLAVRCLLYMQMALPFDDYVKLMPGVEELRTVFKLDSEVVFMVGLG